MINEHLPAMVQAQYRENQKFVSLRKQGKHYPMMIVISTVYPCNFGCPNCPYSEENSELRSEYQKLNGDYIPQELWNRIAEESGPHGTWLRCTGGGEPMMHPKMVEMISYAKQLGCAVWLNTNGSLFGPNKPGRLKLEKLIEANTDLIEFSMDAGDASTYALVRPPLKGNRTDPDKRWNEQVSNIRFALEFRKEIGSKTRIVVSVIRQKIVEKTLDKISNFWLDLGVDEVITRKFLSWDDNTKISLQNSADSQLYTIQNLASKPKEPCVWPFERLNVDTLGRIALCGQDISFKTSHLFPNANDASIEQIWNGATFTRYREKHLQGDGASLSPCTNCSAWKAGVRDWNHGWIKVLNKTGEKVQSIYKEDLGVDIELVTPEF